MRCWNFARAARNKIQAVHVGVLRFVLLLFVITYELSNELPVSTGHAMVGTTKAIHFYHVSSCLGGHSVIRTSEDSVGFRTAYS